VGRLRLQVRALVAGERWPEARERCQQLLARDSTDVAARGQLGVIAARLGDHATAERIDDELERLDGRYLGGRHTMWRARIAAALGEHAAAATLASAAVAQGHLRGVYAVAFEHGEYDLHIDPAFEALRETPPFRELLTPR
jgi:hypothetical protein